MNTGFFLISIVYRRLLWLSVLSLKVFFFNCVRAEKSLHSVTTVNFPDIWSLSAAIMRIRHLCWTRIYWVCCHWKMYLKGPSFKQNNRINRTEQTEYMLVSTITAVLISLSHSVSTLSVQHNMEHYAFLWCSFKEKGAHQCSSWTVSISYNFTKIMISWFSVLIFT